MMEWFIIVFKAFWCGIAALGFAVLFNAPARTLVPVWFGGFIAGLVKFSLLSPVVGAGFIFSSFAAALTVGFISIPVAQSRHVPPIIFAVPSVIPLIPGVFAYKTMLGLMKLTANIGSDYSRTLSETTYNGVITLFVILALALGVNVPQQLLTGNLIQSKK